MDNAMIVATVVVGLFGFVYFFLFCGMYFSRKRALSARLEDDPMREELYKEYLSYIEDTKDESSFVCRIEKQWKGNKKWSIISLIFSLIVSAFCIVVLSLALYTHSNGDQFFIGDNCLIVVTTGSMSEANTYNRYLFENDLDNQIEGGSLIMVTRNYEEIELYDIVAFKGEDGETIIHRVIEIEEDEEGNPLYTMRGDTNVASMTSEVDVTPDRIVGVHTGFTNLFLGQFIMYMQSGVGLISVAVAVVVIITFYIYCEMATRDYKKRYLLLASSEFADSLIWDLVESTRKHNKITKDTHPFVKGERVILAYPKEGMRCGDMGTVVSISKEKGPVIRMDGTSDIVDSKGFVHLGGKKR